MPERSVQLRVWMIGFNSEEQDSVAELIESHNFTITTTWEPDSGELEYQTTAFENTESNQNTIRELKSELDSQFADATVSLSDLDKSNQNTQDQPFSGVYHIRMEY